MMAEYVQSNDPSVFLIGPFFNGLHGPHENFRVTFLSDNTDVISVIQKHSEPSLRQLCTVINLLVDAFQGSHLELWFWNTSPAPQLWITARDKSVKPFSITPPPDWIPLFFGMQSLVIMRVHATLSRELLVRNILLTLEEIK